MTEHRSIVVDPDKDWKIPENYVWVQGADAYCRKDVAGMYTGDGRLKRVNCSVCGMGKGYVPSFPCDCHPDAEWEVKARPPFTLPREQPLRRLGYTALPDGGGALRAHTPRVSPADLPPDERPLSRSVARADLEGEGFVLPAPSAGRLSEEVAGDLLRYSLKHDR